MNDMDMDRGPVPHNRTDTSRAAAASQQGESLARKRRIVYDYIRSHSQGATCDEIEVATGMRHSTISARINELWSREPVLVVDSGVRRLTRSNRSAKVWIAVRR